MKSKLLLGLFLLKFSISLTAQTITLDAESGNRAVEQANCWAFGATSYTNTSGQVISGTWSVRGNSLSNTSLTSCWITSPWILPADGKISLKVKMENTSGTGGTPPSNYKMVSVRFRAFDPNASFGQGEYIGGQQDYIMQAPVTTAQSIGFEMPAELVKDGKPVKVMFSFSGNGGNNRPNIDDISIPGTYYSDPANGCLPKMDTKDADGDGVSDDDDAYPEDPHRAYNNYLISKGYSTLMFEDLWPAKGDFDFNDLVVDYKMNRITNAKGEIVDIVFTYQVKAIGAGFKNGLGVELTGINPNEVYSVKGNSLKSNIFKMDANGLEAGTKFLTFIAFDNAFDLLPPTGGGVTGVNTTIGAAYRKPKEETVVLSLMKEGVSASGKPLTLRDVTFEQFNPFLIANQNRGVEIHLADKPPTALADAKLFGTRDDASAEGRGVWYKSKKTFMPWALHVGDEVPYPAEKVSIVKAYPFFVDWVKSNGTVYADWYIEKYREEGAIYR